MTVHTRRKQKFSLHLRLPYLLKSVELGSESMENKNKLG